jgi:PAS domain S-box-containing protein
MKREKEAAQAQALRFQREAKETLEHKVEERTHELKKSEEKYKTILASIDEGYYELNLKGDFTFINDAVCEIWGLTREELTGMNYRDYMSKETAERAYKEFNRVFRTREPGELLDWEIIRGDRERRHLETSVGIILSNSGRGKGFRGIVRDITEKKLAEEALKELEMQKSRFFANISHEIRTPLTLILSPIESVLQDDYEKEVNKKFFKNLQKNAIRLLRLINNLLDFSKLEAGRMSMQVQEVNMVKMIKFYIDTVRPAADTKNIHLIFHSEKDSINLFLDLKKSDKIAMNIFSNALKFTEKGGEISFLIREDETNCYIEIRDTGVGIPYDKLDLIFDRFSQADSTTTRKYEGTGIGLALAKEFVEMHNGNITVESKYIDDYPEDHGTCFTLIFPKGKNHLENRPDVEFIGKSDLSESIKDHRRVTSLGLMEDMKDESSNGLIEKSLDREIPSERILIVEDNPEMRNFLKILLHEYYNVYLAENGEEGLKTAEKIKPSLIITDVMMPIMNGYEMTKKLKEDKQLKRIPVLMLTARVELSQKIEGLEYGANDYLTKPFNSKELLTRIKILLKSYEYEKMILNRNIQIEKELEIARLLQHKLLPEKKLEISGYNFHATYIPMDKVGGDFYDYKVRDNCIDLFIADVSGHGLPGAFLSMITKMALESITQRTSTNKVQYLLNDVIHKSTVKGNYVTSFFCTIDKLTNIVKFTKAGHVPPLLFRKNNTLNDDEFIELKTKGTPLGLFKSVKYEEGEIQLLSGDRLVFYTDGVTECMNDQQVMYGTDEFKKYIKNNIDLNPQTFSTNFLETLKKFSGSEHFKDDLTLLIFDVL